MTGSGWAVRTFCAAHAAAKTATTVPCRRFAALIDVELIEDQKASAAFPEKDAWLVIAMRLRESSIEQGLYAVGGERFGKTEKRQERRRSLPGRDRWE
jgi:hypothetical protein